MGRSRSSGGALGHDPVVRRVLAHVRRQLDLEVVWLEEFVDHHAIVRAVAGDATVSGMPLGSSLPQPHTLGGRVLAGTLDPVGEDLSRDPATQRIAQRVGLAVRSYAAVPLHLTDGTVFGTLIGVSRHPLTAGAGTALSLSQTLGALLADQLAELRDQHEAEKATRDTLERAANGELEMVFQPIIDLTDGATVGVEALARFPDGADRPPQLWFAEAVRAGIGLEVEQAAVSAALGRSDELPDGIALSVNASPALVLSGRLTATLGDTRDRRLVVEMTEHTAVEDYDELRLAVDDLRHSAQVRVAIDDVGGGFANLHHVLRLLPDVIKLDAGLTRYVGHDRQYDALARSLADYAERAGASLVAEAIETPGCLAALRHQGVGFGQGYLFAAPCHPDEVREGYPVGA